MNERVFEAFIIMSIFYNCQKYPIATGFWVSLLFYDISKFNRIRTF